MKFYQKKKHNMKNSGKFEALENLKRKKQNRRWRERRENEEREEQEGCTQAKRKWDIDSNQPYQFSTWSSFWVLIK